MKSLALFFALFSVAAHADTRSFSLVTETAVDGNNLFVHPAGTPISARDAHVPASIAHRYVLRSTYTVLFGEADAKIEKVNAGCGDWGVSCWKDHLAGELDLSQPGASARFELIDGVSGRVIGSKTLPLEVFAVSQSTQTMGEKVDFDGSFEFNVRSGDYDEEEFPKFALADGNHSLFFSGLYEDTVFRGARLQIKCKGAENHYLVAGLEFGNETDGGEIINLVPGAKLPNAGIWMSNEGDENEPYLVGEPGSRDAFTSKRVVKVQ
jgi:hypothetical protein